MAESAGKENIKWTTTIIISSSLKSCEIATALENRSHKIRYSDSVENGTIIFSLTGVAFLLMDAQECFMSTEEIFLAKIEKFINIHQNCFLVLSAALHGPEEWKLMFRIQQRYGRMALDLFFLNYIVFTSVLNSFRQVSYVFPKDKLCKVNLSYFIKCRINGCSMNQGDQFLSSC
ncbi:PREDICTED: uncharacterized protein C1orf146 homolog isoform X2 [Hipposideros armiger]|uniref:Uncharacterized protein C1orf146 homolog isoform X2 n=1 Tax=Hipposideros armiger TaxID=186990 RepID=A0A8B7Q142_HIPAR|nr:PREDICTED: uncharacterized protein C1orf146 homolog isoform X2 [Hipposideros armiger]